MCYICSDGFYAENEGSTACEKCSNGKYTNSTKGFSECTSCVPGTYSSPDLSHCVECAAGKYSIEYDASDELGVCIQC
jgi:hypothetical protein